MQAARSSTAATGWRLAAGTAAGYLLLAELGHFVGLGEESFATFWPVAGLHVGLLLTTGTRRWPWIMGAAFAANLVSNVLFQRMPAGLSAGFALANMVEALLAAVLVRRLVAERIRFASVRESLAFVQWGVLAGPAAGATIALASLAIAGQASRDSWLDWWATDALGILMLAPLVVSLHDWKDLRLWLPGRRGEATWVLLVLVATHVIFFRNPVGTPTPYVVLPPMLWAALRFGVGGGMLTLFLSALVILLGTNRGYGPYSGFPPSLAPFLIQTTLATFGLTLLALSTLFREREVAEREVLESKALLEERVRQRTRELEASEEVYRHLFELSPDGIFVHREGRIVFANAALLRILGAERPEQVLGRTPLDFIARESQQQAGARVLQVLADGAFPTPAEQRWHRLDGKELFVEVSSARHEGPRGRGVQVLVRDISERRRVQLELEERELRLRLAVQAARMFAFEWNPRTGIMRRSGECEEILGLPGGVDDPDDRFMAGVLAEDRSKFQSVLAGLTPQADHYTTLYRFRRPDGEIRQLEETARGGFDEHGRLTRLVGMTVDVTAREDALWRLRASEARFANVASAVPATLFTTQPNGDCDYINESFLQYSGLAREQALGFGWTTVMHPEDRQRAVHEWRAALSGLAPFVAEYRMRRADGAYRWFKADCRPVIDQHGAVRQWVGVALDVEDQKRTQELLRQADRRKDEFLAMLAHELRTPLAPIRSAVDILGLHSGSDPQLGRAQEVLVRQVAHLTRLVDDLLDVSRVTHGKIKLAAIALDFAAAVQTGADLARPQLEAKRQRLELDLPVGPVYVRADPTRFAQILGNLLGNAVKYSPEGSLVRVSAEIDGDQALLRVADQGMGIPRNLLPHVFELFIQGERSLDRAQGGLGLGLALVKALVELHEGSVSAFSAGPGQGATFEVRLPLAPAPLESVRAPVEGQPEGAFKRILLVEDNFDAAEMLSMLLRMHGYSVEISYDGSAALDAARRFQPDVALLDLGLPILDGYQVARRLRADPKLCACRLIALSGYGQPEDRARSKDAGFDLHLVKPVDPAALVEAIEARSAVVQ